MDRRERKLEQFAADFRRKNGLNATEAIRLKSLLLKNIDDMQLPPCHILFQFYVAEGRLSCQLYQRSADVFLGVPYNIASYSILLMMIAQVTGLEPGEFIHTIGDAHIYTNHVEQMELQLTREPRHLPALEINHEVRSIDDFKYEDFVLHSYDPHPHIKGEISV